MYWPYGFLGLLLGYMLLTFLRGIVIFFIALSSSKNMHNAMVFKIARAPILFFDSHPVGRIQTRFSKDTSTLDLLIPPITVFASFGLFRTLTVFLIICVIQPFMILIILIAGVFMYCVFNWSVPTLIQAQRMDSMYRGPINSGISNLVTGLVSIRAYERAEVFKKRFIDDLEKSCNVTFTFFVINRLMGFLLDTICLIFTGSVSVFTMLYPVDKSRNAQLAFAL